MDRPPVGMVRGRLEGKMKKYIATYWRGNPQLPKGGYETTREIEAKSIASARKQAREKETCSYGTMTLLTVELKGD